MEEKLVRRCIEIAASARAHGNHPFGALLATQEGEILIEAENTVVTTRDVTAHAELNVVRLASAKLSQAALDKLILVTSTEPCPMCAGAIFWAGISMVVYGLSEDVLYDLTGPTLWSLKVACRDVFGKGGRAVEVRGPLLEHEARKPHEAFWTSKAQPK